MFLHLETLGVRVHRNVSFQLGSNVSFSFALRAENSPLFITFVAMAAAIAIAKLDAQMHVALVAENVKETTMVKLADADVINLTLLTNAADDKANFRLFLTAVVGLDVTARASDWMEVAKLMAIYDNAKVRNEVLVRANAERTAQFLPPQIQGNELDIARAAFVAAEFEIDNLTAPSKAYFERKLGEVETSFAAECLTQVTTVSQTDSNTRTGIEHDPHNGTIKLTAKSFGAKLPANAEQFRSRMRTMAICFCYARSRFPSRRALTTVSITVFDRYVEWLFGPTVWNQVTRDFNDKPISCPTMLHMMNYDKAIRKEVATQMNTGIDFKTALVAAQDNTALRLTSFLQPVSIDAGSSACRALSAPGLEASPNSGGGGNHNGKRGHEQLALEDGPQRQSKKAKKAAKAKAKAAAASAQGGGGGGGGNRGGGDGGSNGGGGKAGGGAGKGAGKKGAGKGFQLPDGASHTVSATSAPICFNFNIGKNCPPGCTRKHVCWFCEGTHAGGQARTC